MLRAVNFNDLFRVHAGFLEKSVHILRNNAGKAVLIVQPFHGLVGGIHLGAQNHGIKLPLHSPVARPDVFPVQKVLIGKIFRAEFSPEIIMTAKIRNAGFRAGSCTGQNGNLLRTVHKDLDRIDFFTARPE